MVSSLSLSSPVLELPSSLNLPYNAHPLPGQIFYLVTTLPSLALSHILHPYFPCSL